MAINQRYLSIGNNNNTPDIAASLGNGQNTLVTSSISTASSAAFDYNIYNLKIDLEAPDVTTTKTVDRAYADVNDTLNYTITVTNSGQISADNVIVTDLLPPGAVFVQGTVLVNNMLIPAADVIAGVNVGSIAGNGGSTIIQFVAEITEIPVPNPLINSANVSYTFLPAAGADPISGTSVSNDVSTLVNNANLTSPGNFVKSATPNNVGLGEIITYTLNLTNTGNAAANNVIVLDQIPAGTTYVAGSATATVPFSGSPETLICLTAPIPAGGTAEITYLVMVGNTVPDINPIPNTATVSYTYTVDPTRPNCATDCTNSNTVTTQVINAILDINSTVDKAFAYVGDTLLYQIAITNTGNVPTDNVILTDPVSNGTAYVLGSLAVNVAFTGTPMTTIHLTNPIAVGETVSLSYQVKVIAIPLPNPISNTMTATFNYTVNPLLREIENGSSTGNTVTTLIFKNNFGQEISDLIHSIALGEAAIAGITNAEGAKIQKILALGATPNELICANNSVTDILESLGTLEAVIKQKLSAVDCQINPTCI